MLTKSLRKVLFERKSLLMTFEWFSLSFYQSWLVGSQGGISMEAIHFQILLPGQKNYTSIICIREFARTMNAIREEYKKRNLRRLQIRKKVCGTRSLIFRQIIALVLNYHEEILRFSPRNSRNKTQRSSHFRSLEFWTLLQLSHSKKALKTSFLSHTHAGNQKTLERWPRPLVVSHVENRPTEAQKSPKFMSKCAQISLGGVTVDCFLWEGKNPAAVKRKNVWKTLFNVFKILQKWTQRNHPKQWL